MFLSLSIWWLGSSVVLDCISAWYLHSSLLLQQTSRPSPKNAYQVITQIIDLYHVYNLIIRVLHKCKNNMSIVFWHPSDITELQVSGIQDSKC